MAPRIWRRTLELVSMAVLTTVVAALIALVTTASFAEAPAATLRSFALFVLPSLALWFVASSILAAVRRSRSDRELYRWELLIMGVAVLLAIGFWVANAIADPYGWAWLIAGISLPHLLALALIAVLVLSFSRVVFLSRYRHENMADAGTSGYVNAFETTRQAPFRNAP